MTVPPLDSSKKMRIETCPPVLSRAHAVRQPVENIGPINIAIALAPPQRRYTQEFHNADVSQANLRETWIIDARIKALIPSQAFRTIQTNFWKSEQNWYWYTSILTGIFTALGAVAALKKRAEHPVGLAIGVASAASALFTTYNIFSYHDAAKQVKAWEKDPRDKIADARIEALAYGFSYVKQHDLRLIDPSNHAILLEEEVEYLYDGHFQKFCERLLDGKMVIGDAAQHQWLNEFTRDNPVARDVLEYAYGHVPNKFAQVSSDYEVLHAELSHLRDQFEQMRKQRRQETQNIIDDIQRYRQAALLPFQSMYSSYVEQANQERARKLERKPSAEEKARIEREYNATIAKYNQYLLFASAPVNLYFDGQITNARRDLENILAQINRHEAAAHAPYFNYSKGLLEYARNLKNQPAFEYVQQPLPQNVYNIPEVQRPSAPPAEHDFAEQAAVRPDGMGDGEYQQYLVFIQKR